ncbi:MAG: response regulator [Candidatus Omnitrophica bacterium]|nr:response regulator [Candidatus Omnitrophota bacterium]
MLKNILIVEDEPDTREAVEACLVSRGYKVIVAEDGQEALRKVKSQKPDLVLLDIMIPKPDGWQVLNAIRSDEETRELPVIMLTANRQTSSLIESQNQKATDYLMKPFDIEQLLRFVHRYI